MFSFYRFTVPTVRLVGSDGEVQVYVDGKWGEICHDNFDFANERSAFAEVVCRQLGYNTGYNYTTNSAAYIHIDNSYDKYSPVYVSSMFYRAYFLPRFVIDFPLRLSSGPRCQTDDGHSDRD